MIYCILTMIIVKLTKKPVKGCDPMDLAFFAILAAVPCLPGRAGNPGRAAGRKGDG